MNHIKITQYIYTDRKTDRKTDTISSQQKLMFKVNINNIRQTLTNALPVLRTADFEHVFVNLVNIRCVKY